MSQFITVVDVGSTKVVALAAMSGEDGKMKIKGLGVAEHRGVTKGKITDATSVAGAIDAAIQRVSHTLKAEVDRVIVGIGGPLVEGTTAQGFIPIIPRSRSVTREDVLQVINHSRQLAVPPGREQIQVIPREFRIDGQGDIQEPVGLSGSRLEVVTYLVFGVADQVEALERAVQANNREVDQMILRPLASALGVMTPSEVESGTAVVDIGYAGTEVAVMRKGSIAFSAYIPAGSHHITSDLYQLLKCEPSEAERLKVEHGAALASHVNENDTVQVLQAGQSIPRPMQRKVLCEIIESRAREIAKLVRQELDRSGMLSELAGGLVLTGGGSKLPSMDALFESVFPHSKVRVAEPNLQGLVESRPGLAAAVGMARYALQVGEDEIAPASGIGHWKDRVSRLISALSGKA